MKTKNNTEHKGDATLNAIINCAKRFLSSPRALPASDMLGGCAGSGERANLSSATLGATTPLEGAFGHGSSIHGVCLVRVGCADGLLDNLSSVASLGDGSGVCSSTFGFCAGARGGWAAS